jgi:hypothetical protein
MRRVSSADLNQHEIVQGLREADCSVAVTSSLGDGFPDLVVARSGVTVCMEVKNPERRGKDRQLRETQEHWSETWKGKFVKVETLEEALEAMNKAVRG